MISRKHRFHGHGSLRFTYQNGKTIRGQFCALKFTHNSKRSTYRVAVVVSKKVSKFSVVRNRIRRRLYEVVRQTVPADQPYDMIFTVFSDRLASMSVDELQHAVVGKLIEAKIVPPSTHAS